MIIIKDKTKANSEYRSRTKEMEKNSRKAQETVIDPETYLFIHQQSCKRK